MLDLNPSTDSSALIAQGLRASERDLLSADRTDAVSASLRDLRAVAAVLASAHLRSLIAQEG